MPVLRLACKSGAAQVHLCHGGVWSGHQPAHCRALPVTDSHKRRKESILSCEACLLCDSGDSPDRWHMRVGWEISINFVLITAHHESVSIDSPCFASYCLTSSSKAVLLEQVK